MLKIYDTISYVSIDGADWRSVGVTGYRVSEEELTEAFRLNNVSFDESYQFLSYFHLDGIGTDVSFFRKKPIIWVKYRDAWESVEYRHFKTISYKTCYVERAYVTLDWIMNNLTVDQAIQYLKERGINTCPILK